MNPGLDSDPATQPRPFGYAALDRLVLSITGPHPHLIQERIFTYVDGLTDDAQLATTLLRLQVNLITKKRQEVEQVSS
jgi:hypothetical protein